MIKLKKLLKESKYVFDRNFGEALPTLSSVIKKYREKKGRGYCYTLGDEGACMWMLPGGDASFGLLDYAAFAIPTLFKCGPGAVRRGVRTGEAMEARHPSFEHAYLFSIGLRPSAQGKGLGRRLIQPVLDACDRKGLPAYLENSNPANTGFYTSCGFEPLGDPIHPEAGCPPLVPMVRQPRRS